MMSERNVSKAAEKVFLSQSGMSHALSRLCTLLDDPILMRTEQGMMPTPRALEMEVPVREMLNRINRTIYTQKIETFAKRPLLPPAIGGMSGSTFCTK